MGSDIQADIDKMKDDLEKEDKKNSRAIKKVEKRYQKTKKEQKKLNKTFLDLKKQISNTSNENSIDVTYKERLDYAIEKSRKRDISDILEKFVNNKDLDDHRATLKILYETRITSCDTGLKCNGKNSLKEPAHVDILIAESDFFFKQIRFRRNFSEVEDEKLLDFSEFSKKQMEIFLQYVYLKHLDGMKYDDIPHLLELLIEVLPYDESALSMEIEKVITEKVIKEYKRKRNKLMNVVELLCRYNSKGLGTDVIKRMTRAWGIIVDSTIKEEMNGKIRGLSKSEGNLNFLEMKKEITDLRGLVSQISFELDEVKKRKREEEEEEEPKKRKRRKTRK